MSDQKNKQSKSSHPDNKNGNKDQGNPKTQGTENAGNRSSHRGDKDSDQDPVTETESNPERKKQMNDNPDETKRKVSNMKK
jgi:hypothetical protein